MAVSANLTRMMDAARIRLPGANDDAIRLELFSALEEFFRGSNCWREEVPFTARPNKFIYDIESQDYTASVIRLVGAKNADGTQVYATMPTTETIQLAVAPAGIERYVAEVILTVSDPVTTEGYPRVPSWIVDKHREGILEGVFARMMSTPAKPYTSERHAIYHMRRFQGAISRAKVEALHLNVQGAQRWRFPKGFV